MAGASNDHRDGQPIMQGTPVTRRSGDHHDTEQRVGDSRSSQRQRVGVVEIAEGGTDRHHVTYLPRNTDLDKIAYEASREGHRRSIAGADDQALPTLAERGRPGAGLLSGGDDGGDQRCNGADPEHERTAFAPPLGLSEHAKRRGGSGDSEIDAAVHQVGAGPSACQLMHLITVVLAPHRHRSSRWTFDDRDARAMYSPGRPVLARLLDQGRGCGRCALPRRAGTHRWPTQFTTLGSLAAPWSTPLRKVAGVTAIISNVLVAAWLLLEVVLRKRGAASSWEAAATDRNSTRLVIGAYVALAAMSLVLTSPGHIATDSTLAWIATGLGTVGLALRAWAMQHLGSYYSRTLHTQPDQPVVDDGPYRWIRHPGYTGSILVWAGSRLALNWVAAAITLAVLLVVYAYRMSAEEELLTDEIGQPYRDYQAHTWKLIPPIW